MKSNAELHIVLPGVCGPLAEIESLKNSEVTRKWLGCLAKASSFPSAADYYELVSALFRLSIKDDFPSAALCLLANDLYDVSMNYMHADPVHLRADLDHAVLTSSADLYIHEKESENLCLALNQHFIADGLNFFRLNKNQWFVSAKKAIHLQTTPLANATGRNINYLLPKGEHSAKWKQVLTEAQMLMHTHEVNIDRESSGQQSINSLWFHGCGELPEFAENKISSICSDDDMLKGLSRHVKCQYLNKPQSADDYINALSNKNLFGSAINFLHLSELEHLVNYTDVTLWQDKLEEILNTWIYPLIKKANKQNIKVILYPCNGKQYHFKKYHAVKFWRQGKIGQYIGLHKTYVE